MIKKIIFTLFSVFEFVVSCILFFLLIFIENASVLVLTLLSIAFSITFIVFLVGTILIYLKFIKTKKENIINKNSINASLEDINLFDELFTDLHSGIILLNNEKKVIEISSYLKQRNFEYFINKPISDFIDLNKSKNEENTLSFNQSFWKMKYFDNLNIVFVSDETNTIIYKKLLKKEFIFFQIKFDYSHLEDLDIYEITTVLNILASKINIFFKQNDGLFLEVLSKNFGFGIISKNNLKNYKNYLIQFFSLLQDFLKNEHPNYPIKFYIGLSHGGDNFSNLFALSSEALKYAQLRGDYQIVSKNENNEIEYLNEDLSYLNDNSYKVDNLPLFVASLQKKLIYVDKVFVVTHKNADLDAIGSAYAINQYLNNLKIKNDLYIRTTDKTTLFYLTKNYPFINKQFKKTILPNEITSNSILIITDTSKDSLLEDPKIITYFSKENIFIIDHHNTSKSEFIDVEQNNQLLNNTSASSASEVVIDFIKYASIKKGEMLDETTLSLLTAGIYLDTNGFKTNISKKTFEYLGWLISKIGNLKKITDSFSKTSTLDLEIYGEIIKNHKRADNLKAIISYIDSSKILKPDEIAVFTNELLEFKNVKIAILIAKVSPSKFKASLRSKEDENGNVYYDVSKIATHFGGGGKKNASAFEFDATTSTSSILGLNELVYEYVSKLSFDK